MEIIARERARAQTVQGFPILLVLWTGRRWKLLHESARLPKSSKDFHYFWLCGRVDVGIYCTSADAYATVQGIAILSCHPKVDVASMCARGISNSHEDPQNFEVCGKVDVGIWRTSAHAQPKVQRIPSLSCSIGIDVTLVYARRPLAGVCGRLQRGSPTDLLPNYPVLLSSHLRDLVASWS